MRSTFSPLSFIFGSALVALALSITGATTPLTRTITCLSCPAAAIDPNYVLGVSEPGPTRLFCGYIWKNNGDTYGISCAYDAEHPSVAGDLLPHSSKGCPYHANSTSC